MKKIDIIKSKLSIKTSEQVLSIKEQPIDTCPMIDRVKDDIKDTLSSIQYYCNARTDSLDEAEDKLSEIDSLSSINLDDELEEIRTNVIEIRRWGQEWKDLAISLFEKYGDKEDLSDDLYNKLEIIKQKLKWN